MCHHDRSSEKTFSKAISWKCSLVFRKDIWKTTTAVSIEFSIAFCSTIYSLSDLQKAPHHHSLLFVLTYSLPPEALHWLFLRLCSHICVPLQSLHLSRLLPCSQIWLPPQSLQYCFLLLCSHIPLPPQSLHLFFLLPCWHTWLPPQSLHSFLLCYAHISQSHHSLYICSLCVRARLSHHHHILYIPCSHFETASNWPNYYLAFSCL